jgi:hypothetical protein
MAHKGRAMSDVTFNPDNPPEAYTNPTIQPRIAKYTTVARQVRGPDFDPVREPLDLETVVSLEKAGNMDGTSLATLSWSHAMFRLSHRFDLETGPRAQPLP